MPLEGTRFPVLGVGFRVQDVNRGQSLGFGFSARVFRLSMCGSVFRV